MFRAKAGPGLPAILGDVAGVGSAETLPSTVARHVTEGEMGGERENLAWCPYQSVPVSFAAGWEGCLRDKVRHLQLLVSHTRGAKAKVCQFKMS